MNIIQMIFAFMLIIIPVKANSKNSAYVEGDYSCWQKLDKSYCIDKKGRPLTGRIEIKSAKGKEITFSRYQNGYLSGLTTEYDDKGRIRRKTYYKNGLKSSTERIYYENRTVSQVAEYKDGKLHGKTEQYTEKGKLLGRFDYKNGKLINGYCVKYIRGHKNKIRIDLYSVSYNKLYLCEE